MGIHAGIQEGHQSQLTLLYTAYEQLLGLDASPKSGKAAYAFAFASSVSSALTKL
jgi:hypothetical protein